MNSSTQSRSQRPRLRHSPTFLPDNKLFPFFLPALMSSAKKKKKKTRCGERASAGDGCQSAFNSVNPRDYVSSEEADPRAKVRRKVTRPRSFEISFPKKCKHQVCRPMESRRTAASRHLTLKTKDVGYFRGELRNFDPNRLARLNYVRRCAERTFCLFTCTLW